MFEESHFWEISMPHRTLFFLKGIPTKNEWKMCTVWLLNFCHFFHHFFFAEKICDEKYWILICNDFFFFQFHRPSTFYTIVTWLYYSATEKVFVEMFPHILSFMQLESLESLENLYAPVILRVFTIVMSGLFTIFVVPTARWELLFVGAYFNVYLRGKELVLNSGAALQAERRILNRYRIATTDEIEKFDDVCAVCLFAMKKARVTPCHHLFHADCLRQCLKTSDKCPMCKRELKFD